MRIPQIIQQKVTLRVQESPRVPMFLLLVPRVDRPPQSISPLKRYTRQLEISHQQIKLGKADREQYTRASSRMDLLLP